MRDGEVAKEGTSAVGNDCEVCVVAFEGRDEGMRYGVCWIAGQSAGRIEVFYSCLGMVSMAGSC